MQCNYNPFLRIVDNYHLCLIIIAFALALFCKNKRWAMLSGIVACFYYIGYMTLCDVIAFDTTKVWRYIIWALWDTLLMASIYFAWRKNWLEQHPAIAVMALCFGDNLLQAFRFVDRHYFDLAYSSGIYTTMAPTLNNLLVLVCLYPLITTLKKGIVKWQSPQQPWFFY